MQLSTEGEIIRANCSKSTTVSLAEKRKRKQEEKQKRKNKKDVENEQNKQLVLNKSIYDTEEDNDDDILRKKENSSRFEKNVTEGDISISSLESSDKIKLKKTAKNKTSKATSCHFCVPLNEGEKIFLNFYALD